MTRKRFLAFGVLLLAAAALAAAKSKPSDFFTIDKPKPFAGTLTDQQGVVMADAPFQLLDERSRVLQTVVTKPNGSYDFGVLQPGRYRVRLRNKWRFTDVPWCKPIIDCSESGCGIKPLRVCSGIEKGEACNPTLEYPVSGFFIVDQPMRLAGTLTDYAGADISEMKFELLNEHKKVTNVVVTTPEGRYDFGILQPGGYRVRIKTRNGLSSGWCNPTVECSASACRIAPLKPYTVGY